jgi:hypothetical protein
MASLALVNQGAIFKLGSGLPDQDYQRRLQEHAKKGQLRGTEPKRSLSVSSIEI